MLTSSLMLVVPWKTFLVVLLHVQYGGGSTFSMISADQHYIADAGGQLSLRCHFYKDHFNLFDNPVQWKKTQYGEVSEINIMGNIKEPFASTERFQVVYDPQPPQHTLILTIKNLSEVDSGNYTCEVKGPKSAELGIVRYILFIRAPVESVFILQGNASYTDDSSVPAISFVENEATPMRCLARGGSPPPTMEISIGREDYTKYFRSDSVTSLTGDIGFRTLQITKLLVTDDFRATSKDDGKKLKCKVQVHGITQVVKSAHITVNYAPKIKCQSQSALKGDRNVRVNCEVTAHPPVSSWYWVLDTNGTTVSEGEVINGYWTIYTKKDSTLYLQLYVRETKEDTFRKYTLVAENKVGSRAEIVPLLRRYPNAETGRHASNANNSPYENKFTGGSNRDQSSHTSGTCGQHTISQMIITVIVMVHTMGTTL